MLESFKNKNRIKFKKTSLQRNFILKAESVLNLTELELAQKLRTSRRTLQEWKKERISISEVSAMKISRWIKTPLPKDHVVIDWIMHLRNAGRIGAKNKLKKYGNVGGNEEYRKEKWKEWWEVVGKYKKPARGFQTLTKIKIPIKSKLLAEFAGIMLGDGGINRYHITVTLSSIEKLYILFVSKMIKELFSVVPKIYSIKNVKAVKIVVNRKQLVDFCQEIGLVQGNKIKQQIDIPIWIKKNKNFARVCIRGLVDTDGCFYNNSYKVNGKKYDYFKIAFVSASKPLIRSVAIILRNLGINAIINKNYRDLRIVEKQYVLKYIAEIGSHNQKHLQKIRKWKNHNNMLK